MSKESPTSPTLLVAVLLGFQLVCTAIVYVAARAASLSNSGAVALSLVFLVLAAAPLGNKVVQGDFDAI